MLFSHRSFLRSLRSFGSFGSSKGRKLGRPLNRTIHGRRLHLEPLEDRSLLSVGVSGMVWNDANLDGLQDAGELGVAGAVAEIFSSTDDVIGNLDDVSLGVAITDADGAYSFANLPNATNYYVVFRTPVGYEFTEQNVGSDDALDSDADAVGATELFTITAGTTATDIDAGLVGTSEDFGWATSIVTNSDDTYNISAVVTDDSGNVYLAGSYQGTVDFDQGPGTTSLTSDAEYSTFLAKYTSVGAILWVDSFELDGLHGSNAMTICEDGLVCLAAGSEQTSVLMLDSRGEVVWSMNTSSYFSTISAVDEANGTIFLAGVSATQSNTLSLAAITLDDGVIWTYESSGSTPAASIAAADDGSVYVVGLDGRIEIRKIDTEGSLAWSAHATWNDVPSNQVGSANDVALDAEGNVYVVGTLTQNSRMDFDPGPGESVIYTEAAWVWKFDREGNFLWVKAAKGASSETPKIYGSSIAVTDEGNICYSGAYFAYYKHADFNPNPSASAILMGSGIFVCSLDSDGNFLWVKRVCSTDGRYDGNIKKDVTLNAIDVQLDGSVYLTGQYMDNLDFSYRLSSSSVGNVFVTKYDLNFIPDVELSSTSVAERQPAGIVVGDISISGSQADTTYTCALVSGDGQADNDYFKIVDNQLVTRATFNIDYRDSYHVLIRVSDSNGYYFVKNVTIAITDVESTKDASIENLVWYDANRNGIQDEGEPGVAGATVQCFWTPFGYAGDDNAMLVGTTITDEDGHYSFSGLSNGANYYLQITSPFGYVFTTRNASDDDSLDSDVNADGLSDVITASDDETSMNWDAGLIDDVETIYSLTTEGAAQDMAIDDNDKVYIVGYFSGTIGFGPGEGACTLTSEGGNDVFVAAYSSDGAVLWAKRMGGTDDDYGVSIVLASDGSILITGSFEGDSDFDPGSGVDELTSAGSTDIFVVKLDADGNFIWARSLGGESEDHGYGIGVDSMGCVYTTGQFYNTADFDPSENVYSLTSSDRKAFVSKLDADGNFVWATDFAGENVGMDCAYAIAVDSNDSIYIAGSSAIVCKLDSEGGLIWSDKMQSSASSEEGSTLFSGVYSSRNFNDIVVASDGSVYAAGNRYTRVVTENGPNLVLFDIHSYMMVAKWDSSGGVIWQHTLTNSRYSEGKSIALDADDSIYITGRLMGTVDFDPGSGVFPLSCSYSNMSSKSKGFLSVLNSDGEFVWAGFALDTTTSNYGCGIDVGNDGCIYITGDYGNQSFFSKYTAIPVGPTNLSISNGSIIENTPIGTIVGVFSTVDTYSDTTFTYELAQGDGDAGNNAFTIVDNQLLANATFDSSIQDTYSIRVRTTDNYGQSLEKVFTITVLSDETAPTVTLTVPFWTNDTTPSVTVASTEGETVYLDVDLNNDGDFDDEGELGYTTATLTDGTATFDITPELADGTYNLRTRVSDFAGNEGTSDVVSMVVDTTPPEIVLNAPEFVNTTHQNVGIFLPEYSYSGSYSAITLISKGTALSSSIPHGSVLLDVDLNNDGDFDDAGEIAYATADPERCPGCYSANLELPEGTYNLRARVTDAAGNEGVSDVATMTVDLTAPPISMVAIADVGTGKNGTLESTDKLVITWNEAGEVEIASRSLKIDGQTIAMVGGPNADGNCYGLFGPLSAGDHEYTITITDSNSEEAVKTGTFTVAAVQTSAPVVSRVAIGENAAGSNLNGELESTDNLVITWNESSDAGIASRSLEIDGQTITKVGGPSAEGNCFGLFGPLSAGDHEYTITITDSNSEEAVKTGTFNVAAVQVSAPVVSRVAIGENAAGSNLNGELESTDNLVITWNESSDAGIASRSLQINGQAVTKIGGPDANGNCFALFGPLAEGEHGYTVTITDNNSVVATKTGTFAVTDAVVVQPSISNIVVVEAKTGSDLDSVFEPTDKLLITWQENNVFNGATRSLKVDGQVVSTIGGPNSADCCFGIFGPLSAGSHTYSIEATTSGGVKAEANGTIVVVAALANSASGGTTGTINIGGTTGGLVLGGGNVTLDTGDTINGGSTVDSVLTSLGGTTSSGETGTLTLVPGSTYYSQPATSGSGTLILTGSSVASNDSFAGRADLLSAVMQEMGHVLGYDQAADELAESLLPLGRRETV